MWRIAFAFFMIPWLWASSPAQSVAVCLDDRVGLDRHAARSFGEELKRLSGPMFRLAKRHALTCIQISIRTHAPARHERALGLAFTAGGRILPVIELYVTNILYTLGRQVGSERFGRALAKVAFHELQHYVRQDRHHDSEDLFAPTLTGTQLLTGVRLHPYVRPD